MLTFLDGPAAGQSLPCARAPRYLRVVQTPRGEWDALDLLTDTPAVGETVHVYALDRLRGVVHTDGRDAAGRRVGRWEAMASYQLAEVQPDDDVVRDTTAWRQWCIDQVARKEAV